MIAALLLPFLVPQAGAVTEAPAAVHCLPERDGFITMRLRGSIEQEVRWTEPALECTGMSRPDGKGLRVRFAEKVQHRFQRSVIAEVAATEQAEQSNTLPAGLAHFLVAICRGF